MSSPTLYPVVKLFTPDAQCTWLLSEIDPGDHGTERLRFRDRREFDKFAGASLDRTMRADSVPAMDGKGTISPRAPTYERLGRDIPG